MYGDAVFPINRQCKHKCLYCLLLFNRVFTDTEGSRALGGSTRLQSNNQTEPDCVKFVEKKNHFLISISQCVVENSRKLLKKSKNCME